MANKKSVIIRPNGKNAMQSGKSDQDLWVVEPVQAGGKTDPLTGRYGARTSFTQVRLEFTSREQAIAYAERHDLEYCVLEAPIVLPKKGKVYADNFATTRRMPWTH